MQPHWGGWRERMEEALRSDVRVRNAKTRMQEQTNKVKGDATEEAKRRKRRRLEDIESEAMKEEDPEKSAALFEKYRLEYQEGRNKDDREDKRRKVEDEGMFEQDEKDLELRERASGSGQAAA